MKSLHISLLNNRYCLFKLHFHVIFHTLSTSLPAPAHAFHRMYFLIDMGEMHGQGQEDLYFLIDRYYISYSNSDCEIVKYCEIFIVNNVLDLPYTEFT